MFLSKTQNTQSTLPLTKEDITSRLAKFNSLVSEGETLYRREWYSEAEISFTAALLIKSKIQLRNPDDQYDKDRIYVLLCRSRARNAQGDSVKALSDADEALMESFADQKKQINLARKQGDRKSIVVDPRSSISEQFPQFLPPEHPKILLVRAEALFTMGNFEGALIDYYRGNKLRPEMPEFNSGIQKSIEAINVAIAAIDPIRLKKQRRREIRKLQKEALLEKGTNGEFHTPKTDEKQNPSHLLAIQKSKRIQSLEQERGFLQEMFEDRLFLNELSHDKKFMSAANNQVSKLVTGAISYLDLRVEFWRQRNPIAPSKKKESSSRPEAAPHQRNTVLAEDTLDEHLPKSRPKSAVSRNEVLRVSGYRPMSAISTKQTTRVGEGSISRICHHEEVNYENERLESSRDRRRREKQMEQERGFRSAVNSNTSLRV